jgi:hypothetical protein
VTVKEYGELTPRELILIVEGYNELRQRKREDIITSSYYTAKLQRAQEIPSLKKLIEDSRPKKLTRQTSEQMFDVVKLLQTQFGGEGE